MFFTLSGFVLADIFILFFILLLPIPSLPYILYLFGSNTIFEAALVFLIATTLQHLFLYFVGYFSFIFPLEKIKKFGDQTKEEKKSKIKNLFFKVKDFSVDIIKKGTVKEIILLRWIGVHTNLLCLVLGRLRSRIYLIIIPNTFYVFLDTLFYWFIFGTGKIFLNYFFPSLNIDEIISDPNLLFNITFTFIILFYIVYGIKIWKFPNKKEDYFKP
tara:strand:- start:1511 stop:2155 length:645 start_codon:yes stop_codon:yes gene_type:complete